MKRMKKTAVVLISVFLPFLLSGCWDYREVENLALVSGVGVDLGQNGHQYHLTFECVQMTNDQEGASVQPWIIETDGDTIFEAVRNALKVSDDKLYFNPCKVLLLGEDVAKAGILPVLDWFLRDAEPRITQNVVIAKGKTASEILTQEPEPGRLNAGLISNLISETSDFSGETVRQRLYEVDNILNSEGTSLTLPGVTTAEDSGDPKIKLCGAAVFKEDKLTGWLTEDQTQYLNFILNQTQSGLIVTSDNSQGKKTTLEILSSSTQVEPVVKNDSVTMKIHVEISAALGERESKTELPGEEAIPKAEEDAEKTLKEGIGLLISKVQREYDSDIFGFGSTIYQNDPKIWEQLKPEWDSTFKNLKYETDVQIKIRNAALTITQKEGG